MTSLDGVRAIAVIAVLLFHAGVSHVPGGTLGVDVFFVLSGYLITSLLLREVAGSGHIRLGSFWARRARRLLPALLPVLLVVCIWAASDPAQRWASVRLDVLSALFYVANWRFASSGQGYFSTAADHSPVLHLWSLGVEEQFYLLWPMCVLLTVQLCRLWRGHRRTRGGPSLGVSSRVGVFAVAVVGSLASVAWLAYAFAHCFSTSRLYYGTDTRALTLLTGAALAAWCPLPRALNRDRLSGAPRHYWPALAAVSLTTLIVLIATVPGESAFLFRGGFLLVAVLVALLVLSLVQAPASAVSQLLSWRPLAHLGRISYGLYLWHWPVFLFLTAQRTHMHGITLLTLRLAAAVTIAELSFWLIERPALRPRSRTRPLIGFSSIAALAICTVALAPLDVVHPETTRARTVSLPASQLNALAKQQERQDEQLLRGQQPTPAPAPRPTSSSPSRPPVAPLPSLSGRDPLRLLLVGDSTATTLTVALHDRAAQWGFSWYDGSRVGCGIAPGVGAGDGDQSPVPYGACWNWPQLWSQLETVDRPDVSLMVLGHWETVNRKVNGQVMHIGQPAYDALLTEQLEQAVTTLGSTGSHVVLAMAPCYQRPERADGTLYPQDNCQRSRDFNKLIRAVALQHSSSVTVLDLYKLFSPDGKWHLDVAGHQVRDPDGIHFNVGGGQWLAPAVLGELRRVLEL